MQGWAEDVAGMAYALRSLPEGAPCLPQVRASSGVPVPVGDWGAGVGLVGGEGRERTGSLQIRILSPECIFSRS